MNSFKILMLVFFSLTANFSYAQTPAIVNQSKVVQVINGKEFYLHQVGQGQTLYSISKAYNVTIDDIRQFNSITGDKVITGQKLKIPKNTDSTSIGNDSDYQQDLNKDYYEYQTRSKESLFLLALRYRVSIDDIYALNPGIDDQLKNMDIVKIPYAKKNATFITHTVKMAQTLNRLAKDYKMSVSEIRESNPYIARNLEPGQVIRIPLTALDDNEIVVEDTLANAKLEQTEEPAGKVSEKEFCHNLMERGEYRVALMLPFYFSEMDSLRKTLSATAPTPNYLSNPQPFNFIQFYEGFMMALDSLKKVGLKVKVYVYNVEDNVNSAQQVISNPELKKMDIIIGPVHAKSFTVVAGFARENHIYIVNPFSTRDEILSGNPYVFKVRPSAKAQIPDLVNFLNDRYRQAQIFIARNTSIQEASQLEDLKTEMKKNLDVREFPLTDLFTEIVYNRDSLNVFIRKASSNRENVIVIYSDNKAFLLDFMRNITELKDQFPITIIGLPNWKKIEGLDPGNLIGLKTRIFTEDFVDYRISSVKAMVQIYRETYNTEPQKYAFQGYDVGIYFLSALLKYGPHFGECISYFDMDLMNTGYDFEAEPGQGFENTYWKILKMSERGFLDDSKKLPTYDFSKPPSKFYKYQE